MKKILLLILSTMLLSAACEKKNDNNTNIDPEETPMFICNEGTFGVGNASLSLYYESENKVANKVFKKANNRGLGDVLQSVLRVNDELYLMVNASGKIEIVDIKTIKEKAVINSLVMPRYAITYSTPNTSAMVYVSEWGNDGQISVIDPLSYSVVSSIKVGKGPEKLIHYQDKILVCNSGGMDFDSTISIIYPKTNKVIATTVVGDIPIDIIRINDQQIWVLCKGKILYDANWQIIGHTASKLVKLSNIDYSVEKEIELFKTEHPQYLVFNSNSYKIYIGGGFGFKGIYCFDIASQSIDKTPITTDEYYGIGINSSGNIMGMQAPNFTSNGKMLEMNTKGKFIRDYEVGIGPNSIKN